MMPLKHVTSKDIRLKQWEEIVGCFEGLEMGEVDVSVILSINGEKFQMRVVDGVEADILEQELQNCKLGTMIAILRTDDASRPLVIRKIGSNEKILANLKFEHNF